MTIGRVYSIRSHTRPELVYYGSTKETLSRRMAGHRHNYKRFLAGTYEFITSFRLLELGDAKIELVELVEYTEKSQLIAVESRWIREHECVNKVQPARTQAQYRVDNRGAILAWHAAYNATHAEHRNAKFDCPCGGKHTTRNKPQHARTARHQTWLAQPHQIPI